MLRTKIRVLIIEDSQTYSAYLQRIISSDSMLEVVGVCETGKDASPLVDALRPDVITLDLSLPDVERFELLEALVGAYSIPIIVVSGHARACEDALRLGARDFIEKLQPSGTRSPEQFELLLKLKLKTQANTSARVAEPRRVRPIAKPREGRDRIIVIGASLGGTEIIMRLMQQLPSALPGIVIVQHMPKDFTRAYAMRLDQNSAISVHEAEDNALVLPGTALIAPGGRQLTIHSFGKGYRIRLGESEKVGGFCPSVNVMFRSAAIAAGQCAIGVILTGMGSDGAAGMKELHQHGAYTIGQERESCAVFGMPAAAHALGVVDEMLSPDQIVQALIRLA